jgi:hypothetical protein
MKRLVVASIAVVALMCSAAQAWADQPALKVSPLNFGNVAVGSETVRTVTVTNRSDEPIRFGISLLGLGESGTGGFGLTFTGSCIERVDPLPSGETCTTGVSFLPLVAGLFRSRFCAAGSYCIIVRGQAN